MRASPTLPSASCRVSIDPIHLDDGTIKLLVKGLQRVGIVQLIEGPFLTAKVVGIEETRVSDEEALITSRAVVAEVQARHGDFPPHRLFSVPEDASWLSNAIAPLLSCEISQKQALLEAGDVVARLQKILALMKSDQQTA